MGQAFPEWTNRVPLILGMSIPLGLVLVVAGVWYFFSPWWVEVGYTPKQPIPYSHELHVGQLGLDCRYCHASAEVSPVAVVPPSETCMNCHSMIARDSPKLAPLRESVEHDMPIRWVRVHDLPDYAHFEHRAHVRAGVGCIECHGQVDEMEVVTQMKPLSMSWCLDCHRNPAPRLRPPDQVTNMRWVPPADHAELARVWIEEGNIHPPTDCSGCHQ